MKEKRILVLAATSQESLDTRGADVDETCDTIAQAKKRAKYFLTEDVSWYECVDPRDEDEAIMDRAAEENVSALIPAKGDEQ